MRIGTLTKRNWNAKKSWLCLKCYLKNYLQKLELEARLLRIETPRIESSLNSPHCSNPFFEPSFEPQGSLIFRTKPFGQS